MMEGQIGPTKVRVTIECKDEKRMSTITQVDALHSKMIDVKAHKAILVSAQGFTKGAKQKAQRHGIELCIAEFALSDKWKPKTSIPILIKEITPDFRYSYKINISKGHIINAQKLVINDIDVIDKCLASWNVQDFDIEIELSTSQIMEKLGIEVPIFIRDFNTSEVVPVDKLDIALKQKIQFYAGYADQLHGTAVLESITEGKKYIMIDERDLTDYRSTFVKYQVDQKPPNPLANSIICITTPIWSTIDSKLLMTATKID